MYVGLHVKYLLFFLDINGAWIFSKKFEINSNINFKENPSSGRLVVPCGRTDRQADETKQIVDLRNFGNSFNKYYLL